ncbi:MAG: Eco57I restriction-modification methylase domain-containing protein [Promethearchaeota archaeon]
MLNQDFWTYIDNIIVDFENKKDKEKTINRNLGAIYTPELIVDYIISNVFKLYFEEFFDVPKSSKDDSQFKPVEHQLSKNETLNQKILKKLKILKILDPACGSGRFLISAAEKLHKLFKILDPELNDFELKRRILKENLYGIEIEKSALTVTKLRLISWLYSKNRTDLDLTRIEIKGMSLEKINQIIDLIEIKLNLYNIEFLLEFNSRKFDIIIGNPPYVENKKIKDIEFKKKLNKRFKSAYRLFDLSIVFLEKALEILKERGGLLSLLTTNKFLSADYGLHIRQMLINETELKEIVNLSSLPIFGRTAAYPIIISLKKSIPKDNNEIIIKNYDNLDEIFNVKNKKSQILPQKLIRKIPAFVFPISGQINLLNYLYTNFKTFKSLIPDLKIIYRPYGFLNWSKHLDKIIKNKDSENDLILIGTGNVGKYHIKFDKTIKIAKKITPVSYFKYENEFEDIWKELKNQKLIFREIAKDLSWVYDPGLYTNVTGLYFVRIPSFNQEDLFGLLAIMNSRLMDRIFKTLFSSLHMAGGYLRFNGSFIKRLPIPHKIPISISDCGKILQVLYQLQYDLNSDFTLEKKKREITVHFDKFHMEVTHLIQFFRKLNNSLVNLLYLDELYLGLKKDYNMIREFLYSKLDVKDLQFKYLLPRYQLIKYDTYKIEEIKNIISKIKNLLKGLLDNKALLKQIDEIET